MKKFKAELKRIYALRCISISLKIFVINNNLSLEYGSLDGLTKNDMFEVTSKNGDKIFLKVAKIGPHKLLWSYFSTSEFRPLLQGKTAKILSKNHENLKHTL